MDFDWAVFLGSILGALATAGSVYYASLQIKSAALDQRRNEAWRRADVARSLMQRLNVDEELSFCARALDWGVGPLLIPAKYLPLFPKDQKTIEHDPKIMTQALSVGLANDWRAPEALTYRYCFDAFFSYLDEIRSYSKRSLIPREEFVGIDYYLKLLKSPAYIQHDGGNEKVFLEFAARFYPDLVFYIEQGAAGEGEGVSLNPHVLYSNQSIYNG